MPVLIHQKNTHPAEPALWLRLLAGLTINGLLPLIALADLTAGLYQAMYFSVYNIPKVKRATYVQMHRHQLPGLTLIQKWSCWYCEYTNGVLAWIKAIANQTETFSCAIKYPHHFPGQEYQADFYSGDTFK